MFVVNKNEINTDLKYVNKINLIYKLQLKLIQQKNKIAIL